MPFTGNIVSAIYPLENNRYVIGSDRQGLSIINSEKLSFDPIITTVEGKDLLCVISFSMVMKYGQQQSKVC